MARGSPEVRASTVPTESGSQLSRDEACSGSGKSHPDFDLVDLSNQNWINAGKFLIFFQRTRGIELLIKTLCYQLLYFKKPFDNHTFSG